MVKRIGIGVLFLLVLTAYQAAGAMLFDMKEVHAGALQLRFLNQPLTASEVFHLSEDEAQVSAWTQTRGEVLKNASFEREITGDVIYSCRGGGLSGRGMCAVSEDVAYELWGETAVEGEALLIGGHPYTVERVLMEGEDVVLAEVGKDAEILFDVLEMRSSAPGPLGLSREKAEAIAGRTADAAFDYDAFFLRLEKVRNGAIWLPCAAMAVWALLQLRLLVRKRQWAKSALHLASAVSLFTGCALALGAPFYLPERFIPTRWSDFSFWSQALSAAAEERKVWDSMAVYLPDVQFSRISFFVTATAILFLIFLFYWACNKKMN